MQHREAIGHRHGREPPTPLVGVAAGADLAAAEIEILAAGLTAMAHQVEEQEVICAHTPRGARPAGVIRQDCALVDDRHGRREGYAGTANQEDTDLRRKRVA